MPVIECQQLSKRFRVGVKEPGFLKTVRHFFHRRYRNVDAVKDVCFAIDEGEFVGFLGPNGAGKTTTLKMLTGLIHPTAGSVRVVDHTPYQRRHEFLRQITLVMGQKQQLIWDLPAMDSLRINAAVYRVPDDQFKQRVDELSDMLNLEHLLHQPVRKLSLGERMKMELMAALLHQPRVLFLDEPTLGLDINAQAAVRAFLRQYNQRYNATVLMTSHYMADITALCKRVIVIHEGTLIHDGGLDELLERMAPHREVTIEFEREVTAERLAAFAEVESVNAESATLLVRRDELTRTLDRLLDELPVVDLTVTDPPVEKIIGQLFAGGSVSSPQVTSDT
ncbi:MAG: ATP-binding cassette domain-containing protein [Phycisphaera sp.]|nr:ATP-binding cassette domain-containing protein [Phycisphaera sp.]